MDRLRILLLVSLAFLTAEGVVYADSPARPRSYIKETPKRNYVFVMIAPGPWETRYLKHEIANEERFLGDLSEVPPEHLEDSLGPLYEP